MLECMEYYGASVQGIATVFSTAESLDGIPVYSLFTPDDLPGYISRDAKECPMCKEGQKITAIANSYGLSKL
jgi:orotate phosphoribosyltransferase